MVLKWIRSIISSSRKLIGSDYLGNKYYETPRVSGNIQRSVENNVKPEDFQSGEVPQEWEAWLRGRRIEPPTEQEIQTNLQYTSTVLKRAALRKVDDDEKQAQAHSDGLIARETPSENTPGKQALAKGPTPKTERPSTSGTKDKQSRSDYKPDSWSPNLKQKEESSYEPDAWTPGAPKNK